MATINLKDFYPWYTCDEFVEVPDVIAAELFADRRYQKTQERIQRRYKVLSLNTEDGTEASAVGLSNDNPEEVLEMMERHCRLCCALNALPDIQGRRIEARYLRGKSIREIAKAEGVKVCAVRESINRGLKAMKKSFSNNFQNCPSKQQ